MFGSGVGIGPAGGVGGQRFTSGNAIDWPALPAWTADFPLTKTVSPTAAILVPWWRQRQAPDGPRQGMSPACLTRRTVAKNRSRRPSTGPRWYLRRTLLIVNNTPHAVAEAVLMNPDGREVFVAVVKASFRWDARGTLVPLDKPLPIVAVDVFGDPPEKSGLVVAGELTLPKPRVDVILQGDIVPAAASEQLDCTLEVTNSISKTVRVFGDCYWRPGAVQAMLPSRPKPFLRMPIAWERSFGGTDPEDRATVDLRNPVGCGFRKRLRLLEGHPVPNFEDRRAPISNPQKDPPPPVGFGPIAPHWKSRQDFAGTYNQSWQDDRFPLLPVDFDPRFLNAAPSDQQLASYGPGLQVRLTNFTPHRRDVFVLPDFAPVVTVVDARTIIPVKTTVDTVVIEPAAARVSIVARAVHVPKDVHALTIAFAGPLTEAQRRKLHRGGKG